jgi:hypothetical protein
MPVSFLVTKPVLDSSALPREQAIIATADQEDFFLNFNYEVGSRRLEVWINGLRNYVTSDYLEVNEVTVHFNDPVVLGDEVLFRFR